MRKLAVLMLLTGHVLHGLSETIWNLRTEQFPIL